MKEIKDLYKWKDIPCPYTESLNIVEVLVSSNFIYRFYTLRNKILASYSVDIDKLILSLCGKIKKLCIANTNLREKNFRKWTLSDLKNYYKDTVIKKCHVGKRIDE